MNYREVRSFSSFFLSEKRLISYVFQSYSYHVLNCENDGHSDTWDFIKMVILS